MPDASPAAPAALLALCLALAPAPGTAHPHEFVDAGLTFRLDEAGRLAAIDVTWRYDAFTTMLILSDLGMNPAATDLAADEAPELQGFDMDWIEGYNGDLWVSADSVPVALGPPVPGPTTLEGGQILSRHSRILAEPVDPRAAAVVVQVYDPEFYIAYSLDGFPAVAGDPACRVRVFAVDFDAAYARLEAALAELAGSGDVDVEASFPRVGRDFADEIRLDCG